MPKGNTIYKRIAGLLFGLVSLITLTALPAAAVGDAKRVIRVAYPVQEGMTDKDEYGNYCGYTYEYLEEIAQYTDWSYEFVEVSGSKGTDLEMLTKKVEEGEIDLIGGVFYSDNLDKRYDYPSRSYGTAETVLQTLYKKTENVEIDSQISQTFSIAVIEGDHKSLQELEEFCRINRVAPQYIFCSSEQEQLSALYEGRADFILNISTNYVEGVKTVARFAPKPFYFVTGENKNSTLIQELNTAIAEIDQTDPYFATTLYEKYFVPKHTELILSEQEKKDLMQMGTIRVGLLDNQPPFQYRDEKTGEIQGISIGLLSYISEKTGLQFSYVVSSSFTELYEQAGSGEIDIIAGMTYNYKLANQNALALTRNYVSSQYVLMMNSTVTDDSIIGKRLAVSQTSTYNGFFLGEVIRYPSVDACIRAVQSGEADYTYADAYTAQFYLNLPGFDNFKMVPQSYDPRKVCFGITKPGHKTLLTVFNKVILTIPIEKLQAIILQNTVYHPDFSISEFIKEHFFLSITVVAGVLLLVILLLVLGLRQRIKANRKTSLELRKHLQVYELVNDFFVEYDHQTKTLMVTGPGEEDGKQTMFKQYSENSLDWKVKENGENFLQIICSGRDGIREERIICKDGKPHWIRFVLKTIYDEGGVPAYTIGKLNVIDEEKRERELLREKAERDSLTYTYNIETCRRLIGEQLSKLKKDQCGAFLMLDIDYFKSINDHYGHMAGDRILNKIAQLLRQNFRKQDIVGRLGGDEFVIYMGECLDFESLKNKCAGLCGRIREIKMKDGQNITASIGGVLSKSGDLYSDLYQRADHALYQAKRLGRDRFELEGE